VAGDGQILALLAAALPRTPRWVLRYVASYVRVLVTRHHAGLSGCQSPRGQGHSLPVHAQPVHAPPLGPEAVPVRHSKLSLHQPQLVPPVQSLQLNSEEHESLEVHAEVNQRQSLQKPSFGPVELPVAQVKEDWHQPQLPAAVQPPQENSVAQGSGGMHSEVDQRQSLQKPSFGPAKLPLAHWPLESHQPQPERAEQSPQSLLEAQGSAGMQSLTRQRQSPQKPLNGPTESPP
jgi:hypothetical protein